MTVAGSDYNLTKAAQSLNATQPGISQNISALEAETGLQLFVRANRRLAGLTTAGTELLPIAARIVKDANTFQATCRRLLAPPDRTVTLAMGPSPATLLPGVISEFGRHFPSIKVRVHFYPAEQIMEQISAGMADICLCSALVGLPESIEFKPCYTLGWDLLAPRDHPVLSHKPLTLRDIARYPIISYDESYHSYRNLMATFARSGIEPNIAIGLTDLDEMKRCARAGLGVAIIRGRHVQQTGDDTLVVLSLDHVLEPTQIYVGIRPSEAGSSPVRSMAHLFQREASRAGR